VTKNHHWRCGAVNSTTGKACKNIVSAKGDRCYRHLNESLFADATLVGVTESLEDDLFEKLVIYVQRLKDLNDTYQEEIKYLQTVIRNIKGVISGEY
jgi:hypothetical protein